MESFFIFKNNAHITLYNWSLAFGIVFLLHLIPERNDKHENKEPKKRKKEIKNQNGISNSSMIATEIRNGPLLEPT
jgi:hypothetical protein